MSATEPTILRRLARTLAAFALPLAAAVVASEYLLNAWLSPQVSWSPRGLAVHALIDLALVLPAALLAVVAGRRLADRLARSAAEESGTLGRCGLVALLFFALMLPIASLRDVPHERIGRSFDLPLALAQVSEARTDLTVSDAAELCSFGAVRNPALAADGEWLAAGRLRLVAGLGDALVEQLVFLPLLLVLLARRRAGSLAGLVRRASASARLGGRGLFEMTSRALAVDGGRRLAGAAAIVGLLVLVAAGAPGPVGEATASEPVVAPYNACAEGGPVRRYDVSAIDVTLTLNRWGDHVTGAHMYALDANIPDVRAFEDALAVDREAAEGLEVTRVSHGLRKDPIQPLVLRANLGECLEISFTNALDDGEPASMHILGLAHTADNAASAVGYNPDTFARAGQTITYRIPIPRDPGAERAYYFHDHGAGRRRQNMGLFGAIVVEPAGSVYLDVETGEPLDTATGSNWEAIIVDPNLAGRPDGKSFREFVIFYHEIGDEGFTDIRDRDGKKLPLVDDIAGVYRPAARALNYRSEPFRRRLEIEKTAKALGYSSYPFGDPATPIPRSYVGEGVKTRLLHGGSEVFHVHHLHGGGDRWRRNPDADPNSDFWKGLTKVPDPQLTSIHLDSQSIGPGTSYNLEHECGAGGCQQGVGDFLYHCHIGHHYISGMWAFWRVFGTLQTESTNLYGRPLAAIPELFQNPDNPLIVPAPPQPGVSAGELLGLTVDGGRILSAGPTSASEKNLVEWIEEMMPPAGARLDKHDATVWNWITTGSGPTLRVWGEPESDQPFAGYVSATPGQRPEVLFNPKNGRYTWPLFRPQMGQRPPFTARHSGAPWLGEEMTEGRLDGLCAVPGVGGVDVEGAVKRYYPVSSIQLPVPVTRDRTDPEGMIFVLNEEEAAVRNGDKPVEPLTVRSNVGDCVEIVFTNKIPDGRLNKDFSKTNIHSHFVQFDTQASDGVITGFSYEQSVRPIESEDRRLTAPAAAGATRLAVSHTDRLRPGVWIGVGLGEGTCGVSADGQPLPCTEIRKIASIPDPTTLVLDRPLAGAHRSGEAVGVEFVRYNWFSDVDFGTVFFHTHVEFKDWDRGLFGTHVVEPKGSTYHDPVTGEEVRSGTLVDIRVDPAAGGNPVAHNVPGSFREFMLFLHNNSPVEGRFVRGGGSINLRAEPWRLRPGDPAYRFSSVVHGDPVTPAVRAYVGDPVVVRGMGLVERVGGIRFTGHRFHQERYTEASDTRDTTFLGISERFDVSLEGGAGGPGGFPGDYLYYSTLGRDFESGAWGLLRVHDTSQSDLQPLPGRTPPSGSGFPQLVRTGSPPPSLTDGPGDACPPDAPLREYQIVVADSRIVFNELEPPDVRGVVYRPAAMPSRQARTPVVMRANAGECLAINLRNVRNVRSSISLSELVFDPQRSYGSAIGYNYDSTVAPGSGRRYELFADRELGLVLGVNFGDVDSIERGAYAGVVVEPAGATYSRPGRSEELPGGGLGVQADVTVDGETYREMVALFQDQDRRIGQNAMPYPVAIENFNGINYSREPLALRDMRRRPSEVFRSGRWGDPRHVVQVPEGTPLVYRVGQPWGNQVHVPTLEGHRWYLDPDLPGSEQVYNDVLAPGMALDLWFVGGAGGGLGGPGDYLFLDRRQPFLEGGLWNLLRVTGDGAPPAVDRVDVLLTSLADHPIGTLLTARGTTSLRPAGDFVNRVTVHAGEVAGGDCPGPILGTARVDPGSGAWTFRRPLPSVPAQICVASPAGGAAGAPLE